MTNTPTTDHYRAAIEADDAYSRELRRVFGNDACDARYDARGTSTPELQRLSAAKLSADKLLRGEQIRYLVAAA